MGLFSHRLERSKIVAGDHIYTWRNGFAYSHHGIYLSANKVVHFTPDQDTSSSGDSFHSSSSYRNMSSFDSSASAPNASLVCSNIPDCGFRRPESGVTLSCLDCFLGNGLMYRFEYGVSKPVFIAKFRGGTCTTAKCDPPEAVIHRAMYLLHNGFGNYDMFRNNCEDFALYCKTGLLIHNQSALGSSGQASCVVGAPLAAILSSPFRLFISSPVGVVTVTAALYCLNRYATDIGIRHDVVKLEVEDMGLFHGHESCKELADGDTCFADDQVDGPLTKRQRIS